MINLDGMELPVYAMVYLRTSAQEPVPAVIQSRHAVNRPSDEFVEYKYRCQAQFLTRRSGKVDSVAKYINSDGDDWFFNGFRVDEILTEEQYHAEVAKLWLST